MVLLFSVVSFRGQAFIHDGNIQHAKKCFNILWKTYKKRKRKKRTQALLSCLRAHCLSNLNLTIPCNDQPSPAQPISLKIILISINASQSDCNHSPGFRPSLWKWQTKFYQEQNELTQTLS